MACAGVDLEKLFERALDLGVQWHKRKRHPRRRQE